MRGFLAVDKPGGITSHDVVARVRRLAGIKKVGHAGTLDPMATGLLVVAIGPVTRLIRFVQEAEKEYVADVRFGIATDSLDADGEVLETSPMPLSADEVEAALTGFVGEIQQVPPMVSALKKDGVRLHELARQGIEVEREPRTVTIRHLVLEGFESGEHPTATIRVGCSTGTYIRSLGDDIARSLGGRAHLTALRRTRIGSTHVESAVSLDDLTPENVGAHLVDAGDALADLPAVTVDEQGAKDIGHGRALSIPSPEGDFIRVLDGGGDLLAVYRSDGQMLRPEIVLPR